MSELSDLLDNNRRWSAAVQTGNADFFHNLSQQQRPEYLWIGCADSRVPANEIIGLPPGGVFVHRNIANVVVHTDINCLSVIEYAVRVLEVKHIIVCGHYGCGGVAAAMGDRHIGLIDNWLRHIRDIRQKHLEELVKIEDNTDRINRLCELNVAEQVRNVCHTSIVQEAWGRGQEIAVHGLVYGLHDGLLRDLQVAIRRPAELDDAYRVTTA